MYQLSSYDISWTHMIMNHLWLHLIECSDFTEMLFFLHIAPSFCLKQLSDEWPSLNYFLELWTVVLPFRCVIIIWLPVSYFNSILYCWVLVIYISTSTLNIFIFLIDERICSFIYCLKNNQSSSLQIKEWWT